MLSSSLVPALPLTILLLLLIHFTTATTTLHFFAHTSCNADTSIGAPFTADFADGASPGACQDTPNGTVAIYIDAVDVGCNITAYIDAQCQTSESDALGAGKCFFLDQGGGIGGFEALCGAANTNSTSDTSSMVVITDTATLMPSNVSMTAGSSSASTTGGNGTAVTISKGPSATGAAGAGLQAQPSDSGAAEEQGRWKRRALKALVAVGSAEVIWAMV